MDEVIEASITVPEGIADCRLEPQREHGILSYSVTMLYPNIVNGYSRSEVYCHELVLDAGDNKWHFNTAEDIHPKISKLENQLSAIITPK